jgi:myo-inositol-1(or 4)-monophosphatase
MSINQVLAHPDLILAMKIARAAGDTLADKPLELSVSTKSSLTDVVTHMDLQSEEYIVEQLTEHRPTDGIVGEEGAAVISSSGRSWIVDPLDGTVNYLYGLPHWAVSIGLRDDESGEGLVGVVYAPELGAMYVAAQSLGSWVRTATDWQRMAIGECEQLGQALMGTGFGYAQARRIDQSVALTQILPAVRDIRRLGSCAIDLCLVASGHLDGFFESGVNPWDHAAGALMVREAGGQVSGLFGEAESDQMLIATNRHIYPELLHILERTELERTDGNLRTR